MCLSCCSSVYVTQVVIDWNTVRGEWPSPENTLDDVWTVTHHITNQPAVCSLPVQSWIRRQVLTASLWELSLKAMTQTAYTFELTIT